MNNKLFETYKRAILSLYPDITNVYIPYTTGMQNNVLIAKTKNGDKVFKFSTPDLAKKNEIASKLYKMRGIPVPQTTALHVDDIHFEMYDKISGITLSEAIKFGMTPQKIKQVYHDILVEFDKMSQIHPAYLNSNLIRDVHNVTLQNISSRNNSVLGKLAMAFVYMLNIGQDKDMAVFHTDITPNNIIVSPNDKFIGFIDMDNVCVANKNYAFSILASKYKELGFDVHELIDEYRHISQQILTTRNIDSRVALITNAKKALWKVTSQPHQK
ncbi:MAG: hypothetical protein ACLRFK_01075 [Alphaproteobacteria bacterium]